ncbi:MAG: DNA polymerase III subunit beta [Deltaproteobacteria bacterium]|nr:DNA polymerase III subunit beta [Deltaproteobacteria bacterium]
MECTVERGKLLKVLQRVQGIVEKRNTMPILSNIFLEAKSGNIEVSATDLEIFLKDSCDASVGEEGAITVNARKVFEIVKEMTDEDLSISVGEGGRVDIRGGNALFKIVGLPVDEFPSFPVIEEAHLTRIAPEHLLEMVEKTYFAASTDETRYNINGVFLERVDGTLKMTATDGHRLALIEKENEDLPSLSGGVILPRKGVAELRKLFEEREGSFQLGFTKTYCIVKRDNTVLVVRLIDGDFPDYRQVLPVGNDNILVADRKALLSSLKRVSILSSERVKGVRFALSNEQLDLSSSSPEIGEANEAIPVEYQGEDVEIGFNARYIIDVLEVIDTEKIRIEVKGQLDSGIITPMESGGYTYVIMPMRI